jgi:hypothetical protein
LPQIGITIATASEAAAIAAAVATLGNFAHFTWWAIASYAAFLVAHLAGATQKTWVYALAVQAIVIAGVIAMSLTQCNTLVDAAHDNGPAGYIAGNFAMHYWPTIGILLRAHKPKFYTNQLWCATLTFLTYAAVKKPNHVYGCPVPYNAVVLGGFFAGTTFALLLSSHVHVVRHWHAF